MEWKRTWTRQPSTNHRSNKTEECGIFQPFGLLGAIFTGETECRISVTKGEFNKKKALFACKFDLKFKE
jgi:hypothetical protein